MYEYLGETLSRLDWSQRMYTYIPLYCSSKSPFEFTDNQARQRWLAGVMLVALVLAVEPLRRKKSFQWEILRPRESFKRREEKYISRYTQDWAPRITWTDKKDKKIFAWFSGFHGYTFDPGSISVKGFHWYTTWVPTTWYTTWAFADGDDRWTTGWSTMLINQRSLRSGINYRNTHSDPERLSSQQYRLIKKKWV